MSARSTGLFLLAEIQDDLAVGWLGLRYTNLERTYEDVVFISSNYGMVLYGKVIFPVFLF